MKRLCSFFLCLVVAMPVIFADDVILVDMQAHMGTAEAQAAYTLYLDKQLDYYADEYAPDSLRELAGDDLFGALNALMGSTSLIDRQGYSYNSLRNAYVNVDRDLNIEGNIIGYYDGSSMDGTWDSGATFNREHTWPQSKGADKSIAMGHDMQSVRPANTKINGDRGNTPYGESSGFYNPDDIAINNALYVPTNMGSYRGDCARVVMYDYIVYGQAGGHKNQLYNGNAQLLDKLDMDGVFESLAVLLKWHMDDPISLTEMVRNDGAQDYQGNRNPFIDFPELAIQMFIDTVDVPSYAVLVKGVDMWPAYQFSLEDGFVAYLGTPEERPKEEEIVVTGAEYDYDPENGRLIISNVTDNISIVGPNDDSDSEEGVDNTMVNIKAQKLLRNGQIIIIKNGKAYNTLGVLFGDAR